MKKILLLATIMFLLIVYIGCSLKSINNEKNIEKSDMEKNVPTTAADNIDNSQVGTKISSSSDDKDDLNSDANGNNNIYELQKNGLEIIDKQSFWVDFEKWGRVKFVSSQILDDGSYKLQFYLINDRGAILYSFPSFYGNQSWFFYELRSISFRDANKDGLKDVIVIADYVSGAGEGGAIPFPVASIYFEKDKSFVCLPELDNKINETKKNESINMILKYVEGMDIKLDK